MIASIHFSDVALDPGEAAGRCGSGARYRLPGPVGSLASSSARSFNSI